MYECKCIRNMDFLSDFHPIFINFQSDIVSLFQIYFIIYLISSLSDCFYQIYQILNRFTTFLSDLSDFLKLISHVPLTQSFIVVLLEVNCPI